MQEIEAGEPADLEIEAPPGLLPNLEEWGINEVERGVCEDTAENRKAIRQNKGQVRTVFDTNGNPTAYIQVISAEMYQAAQGMSKAALLADPDDLNSDYLNGVKLLVSQNAHNIAPTWVINTTKTYIRQQDRIKELGADGDLYKQQTRLVKVPKRCSVMKADGTRCWGWADGSTDTNGMCRIHARKQRHVVANGQATRQIMRNRMDSAVETLWDKLEVLTESDDERIALTAIRDMLDRAGYKANEVVEQKVEITHVDAREVVADRLKKLKKGQDERADLLKKLREEEAIRQAAAQRLAGEDIIDAEVVEDD